LDFDARQRVLDGGQVPQLPAVLWVVLRHPEDCRRLPADRSRRSARFGPRPYTLGRSGQT
jgi:hypothetical protein